MNIFRWVGVRIICSECKLRLLDGHCRTCQRPLCALCIDWPNKYLHSPGKGMCSKCRKETSRRHEEYFRLHPPMFQSGVIEPKEKDMRDKDILSKEFEKELEDWERKEFPHLFKSAPWDNASLKAEGQIKQTSNTNRDTQFLGFAGKVIEEINGAYSEDEEIIILARRAYDLVEHIQNTAYVHDICVTMDDIPDMPILPVLPEGQGT